MTPTHPEGSLLKVSLEVRLPAAATDDQIYEWLRYSLGHQGGISMSNPLVHEETEIWGTFGLEWKPCGVIGRREEFDVKVAKDGSKTYKVRFHRDRIATV